MIKKIVCLCLISFSMILMAGCQIKQEDQDITKINSLIQGFKSKDFNGFDYSIVQNKGEDILNSEVIEQRIDYNQGNIRSYTEIIKKTLIEYDANVSETHNELSRVIFYANNQVGELNESNIVEWNNQNANDYFLFDLPINAIKKTYFQEYTITKDHDNQILTGVLKQGNISDVLSLPPQSINKVEIKIVTTQNMSKLLQIEIYITQQNTNTTVQFSPYYEATTVIIP